MYMDTYKNELGAALYYNFVFGFRNLDQFPAHHVGSEMSSQSTFRQIDVVSVAKQKTKQKKNIFQSN